eukprot:CAMPEP_0206437898 /NCGR_PEP_ID=MMETSP0324_2-20121206/11302_1 /ASSEMBLY_ACC=CAM_ASM_000836 /TAXON_ID=2866 /ORGANISM="Crypthecodinium cohnii, Strain Seligo" /LENGTH=93 /DNA_ID=CAMNT_0053905241 /DNA_START=473 /DNA_END=754 /DNA_ORIENTATION=-
MAPPIMGPIMAPTPIMGPIIMGPMRPSHGQTRPWQCWSNNTFIGMLVEQAVWQPPIASRSSSINEVSQIALQISAWPGVPVPDHPSTFGGSLE